SSDVCSSDLYHAAYHTFAHFDRGDLPGTAHLRTFFNGSDFTHQYHTHVVFFQLQGDGFHTILHKFSQLTLANTVQAINAGDTVTHLQYGTYFLQVGRGIAVGQLL